MKPFFENDKIEIGLDEAGRGCLFGPVFTAGVVWNGEENPDIIDSKKINLKKRNLLKQYIENNSIMYSLNKIDNEYIDKHNILASTIRGWHDCISDVHCEIPIDTILVDGPNFDFFTDKDFETIPHVCINGGDAIYTSIAAASILAKTYRDEYIDQLVIDNPELKKYDIQNNKGYGTNKHIEAIKKYGLTKWHRTTFGLCKNYLPLTTK